MSAVNNLSMTSKLSDAEVAAQLREMGLDIGPMNASTRGVYRRKLERLLLEQSILSSPGKYPQQTKTRLKFTTTPYLAVITSAAAAAKEEEEGMEDDPGLDDIPDGSLRLEEDSDGDGSEEDYMEENLSGACGADRNGFGVDEERPSRDASGRGGGGGGAHGTGLQNSGDIHAGRKNLFHFDATINAWPSTSDTDKTATKRDSDTTHAKKALHDDGGSRKEKPSDRFVLAGSFSSVPLPTSSASKNNSNGQRTEAVMSRQLRQRTALPRHQDTANDVPSFERVALKPEDCVPSPRNPLSTYLDRCTPPPPPSTTFHSTDQHPPAGWVKETKPEETGRWFWICVAIFIAICVLGLMVLYNMEPGYDSPI